MKTSVWIALAGTLLMSSAGYALAPNPPSEAGHPTLGILLRAVGRLDLSDSQRSRIRQVADDARAALEGIRDSREDPGEPGLIGYFCSNEFSAGGLEEMMNRRLELMRQANRVVSEALASVREILTPDQLEELAGMAREFRERMESHHLNRGPRRGLR